MEQLSRREFVAAVTAVAACASCTLCGAADALAADAATGEKVTIGTLADYPKDAVYDKFAKSHRLFVIRNDGQLYAASAICTHKNSPLTLKEGKIECKKHGSKFSEHGTSTKGPAKGSLPRYAISQSADQKLIVDTAKSFGEKEWEKPEAFIKVG